MNLQDSLAALRIRDYNTGPGFRYSRPARIDSLRRLGYDSGMERAPGDYWFIIHTKPRQEWTAERSLRSLGIPVYLPLYYARIKRNKTKVPRLSPLFKGYLFARFPIDSMLHKVRYCRGVKAVLGGREGLWTIDNGLIQSIREREADGVVVLQKRPQQFSPGDPIRIDEGDFDGWEGVFYEELPDNERAVIMLTNVHFSSKLIVPKEYLVAWK